MPFTREEQRQMAENFAEAAALRDLNNTLGWEVLCRIAKRRIEQQTNEYLRQDFSQDEAWEARVELRAVRQFWSMIEEMVETARRFVDQQAILELQSAAVGGQDVEDVA
jgi:predicted ArsR family transcriptional regulator